MSPAPEPGGPWTGGAPVRVITARAPTRICDNGGWTDTWFARHGRVFHIAVMPAVEVRLGVFRNDGRAARVLVDARDLGEPYAREPERRAWERHPLIEAVLARVGVPRGLAVQVTVRSDAPAGASTGTSAALTVALAGALARLDGTALAPGDAARLAHEIETGTLGWQSGVQDQLAAAHGGINHIQVNYPHATVHPLRVGPEVRAPLEERLALVYLGAAHRSTEVHERVIARLAGRDPDCRELEDLRRAADAARDAVLGGSLEDLGRAFIDNTEAQARLHPDLVSPDARRIIDLARAHGAAGWKVNGAGGNGGSLALLGSPSADERAAMLAAIRAGLPATRVIPIRLAAAGLDIAEALP